MVEPNMKKKATEKSVFIDINIILLKYWYLSKTHIVYRYISGKIGYSIDVVDALSMPVEMVNIYSTIVRITLPIEVFMCLFCVTHETRYLFLFCFA